MIESITESSLFKIANPESIAFFGSSNRAGSMGYMQLYSLKSMGFEGAVYPIHPEETEVLGYKAYTCVKDLPEVPDLAIIVLPTRIVTRIIAECGEKGIRHAIVVSGGFKEVGNQGITLQKELQDTAHQYGIRLLGPNCIGVATPHLKLNPTPLPYEGEPGYIGLASQSGSFVTQMFDHLKGLGLGFSTAFSVGNEADIDLVDCMEYLGACERTKVIALYIEGIRRGKEFIEMARSIVPHKPIVALYVGGSETGRKASLSHTAAMSGPDSLYDSVFRQSGVIRARSVIELFDFCWVLGSLPLPKGPGLIIQSHSGGPAATAADAAGRVGLDLPNLSDRTLENLAPLVPHTGSVNNPIDLTYTKNPLDFFLAIPEILIDDENADILMIYVLMPDVMAARPLREMGIPEKDIDGQISSIFSMQSEAVAKLLKTHRKPIIGYTFRSLGETFQQALIRGGVPVFKGPERAVSAIRAMLKYKTVRERTIT